MTIKIRHTWDGPHPFLGKDFFHVDFADPNQAKEFISSDGYDSTIDFDDENEKFYYTTWFDGCSEPLCCPTPDERKPLPYGVELILSYDEHKKA